MDELCTDQSSKVREGIGYKKYLLLISRCFLYPFGLAKNENQRTDDNGKVRKIEYDFIQGIKRGGKGKVIHHIFSFQTVVGIGKGAAQKQSKGKLE